MNYCREFNNALKNNFPLWSFNIEDHSKSCWINMFDLKRDFYFSIQVVNEEGIGLTVIKKNYDGMDFSGHDFSFKNENSLIFHIKQYLNNMSLLEGDTKDGLFIRKIINNNFGMTMTGIWFDIYPDLADNLNEAKERFLYVLDFLLRQSIVKLANKGVFLNGTVEEQVQSFREQWPSWDNFDNDLFYVTAKPDKNGTYDIWIPGGLVWIDPDDGSYLWT